MKLVIREYLSMLKEAEELDALLPDLLLNMGIEPLSKPIRGVRQHGVDLAAVGPDIDGGGLETMFLLTIKAGDIRRSDWEGDPQKIRPSLSDILETYIPTHIIDEHKNLPIKIIVCHGGDLGQDVQLEWAQFVKNHSVDGQIAFTHWGGDKLSELIEAHFLEEYLFPESARKHIRKTLALIEDNDYNLRHYYRLINETLFDRKLPVSKGAKYEKKRLKALRLIHLSLSIIHHWAEEGGNLKPALLAAEYTLLRCWDWIRLHQLFANKKTINEYSKIISTYRTIAAAYFHKVQPLCYTRDGLFGYIADEIEYPLRVFEVIGILSTFGLDQLYLFMQTRDEKQVQNLYAISDALVNLVKNNPISASPCYDDQGCDICLALLLLSPTHKQKTSEWIDHLRSKIAFAYATGQHFPITTDSYSDLLDLKYGDSDEKEKLMEISTILPMLAEWCVILNLSDIYDRLREEVNVIGKKTNLQLWYPDGQTEDYLYKTNAAHESGSTQSPYHLPESLEDLKGDIIQIQENVVTPDQISCIKYGYPILAMIACRHFRTPVLPIFWQQAIMAN